MEHATLITDVMLMSDLGPPVDDTVGDFTPDDNFY